MISGRIFSKNMTFFHSETRFGTPYHIINENKTFIFDGTRYYLDPKLKETFQDICEYSIHPLLDATELQTVTLIL